MIHCRQISRLIIMPWWYRSVLSIANKFKNEKTCFIFFNHFNGAFICSTTFIGIHRTNRAQREPLTPISWINIVAERSESQELHGGRQNDFMHIFSGNSTANDSSLDTRVWSRKVGNTMRIFIFFPLLYAL